MSDSQNQSKNPNANQLQTIEKIIFFDGVCNLCNRFIDYVVSHDKNHQYKIASLQGNTAKRMLFNQVHNDSQNANSDQNSENLDSVVLLENGKTYKKSAAAIRILAQLSPLYVPLKIFLPLPAELRDLGYDLVAANRYGLFGKKETCRLPTPEEKAFFLD